MNKISEKGSSPYMIINHNLNAMHAHRNMTINTAASGKSMEKFLKSQESRIRDLDMAKETMTFSKTNILAQAAQANSQPQGVLQLLW